MQKDEGTKDVELEEARLRIYETKRFSIALVIFF